MPARLLGAHMSTSGGGLGGALRSGKGIGCEAVQVFTSSPQQWYSKPVTQEMVDDFKLAQKETGISHVVCHDSYLINLSAPDPAKREQSVDGLTNEMLRCALYGIPYVVSHMGAKVQQTAEEALVKVAEATERILDNTPDSVTLLMETTAGQGSSLNSNFEELGWLLEALKGHPRLAVCLDTCHVFVAGYDIRTPEKFDAVFDQFDKIIGIDRLKVVHCNDSKKGLSSKIDRHEHIGQGEIGPAAFEKLMNDARFESIPIVLETPDAPEGHEMNLKKLRSLIQQ